VRRIASRAAAKSTAPLASRNGASAGAASSPARIAAAATTSRERGAHLSRCEPAEENEPLARGSQISCERRQRKREDAPVVARIDIGRGLGAGLAKVDRARERIEARGVIACERRLREARCRARARFDRGRELRGAGDSVERVRDRDAEQGAQFAHVAREDVERCARVVRVLRRAARFLWRKRPRGRDLRVGGRCIAG
jgi:hypothetical protein